MADRYIPEHRRANFKAKSTFKPEELRRRREEQQVEIRKAKREENLAKRRGIATGENRPGASLGAAPDSDDDTAPTESQVWSLLFSFLSTLFILTSPLVAFVAFPPSWFVFLLVWPVGSLDPLFPARPRQISIVVFGSSRCQATFQLPHPE